MKLLYHFAPHRSGSFSDFVFLAAKKGLSTLLWEAPDSVQARLWLATMDRDPYVSLPLLTSSTGLPNAKAPRFPIKEWKSPHIWHINWYTEYWTWWSFTPRWKRWMSHDLPINNFCTLNRDHFHLRWFSNRRWRTFRSQTLQDLAFHKQSFEAFLFLNTPDRPNLWFSCVALQSRFHLKTRHWQIGGFNCTFLYIWNMNLTHKAILLVTFVV